MGNINKLVIIISFQKLCKLNWTLTLLHAEYRL